MKKIIESDNTNLDFKKTLCLHIETVMALSKNIQISNNCDE